MYQINDKVTTKLLRWYKENQRVLPWRGQKDPYKIWLSEIIMQQTRVVQGTPYYLKIVDRFPEMATLAEAEEQEVLKFWQGLGYYSRARNMHHTAKTVVSKYNGVFPSEYKDILKLKGIGPYTAAAIASIAFNKPYAALDGNVYRVLSRLFGITMPVNENGAANIFQKLADELLDRKEPGQFNEAIMEFGATLCLPKNPLCEMCPVIMHCEAKKQGIENTLPIKIALKAVKSRYFHYLLIKDGSYLYLKEREAGDIWQGLFDLPLIEKENSLLLNEKDAQNFLNIDEVVLKPLKKINHKLTHQRLEITFYEAQINIKSSLLNGKSILVDLGSLKQYPLPKPIELFLNDYLCNPKIW